MNVCANKLVGLSQARVQHAIDTYGHLATFQVQSLSLSFSLFRSLCLVLSFLLSVALLDLSLSLSLSLSLHILSLHIYSSRVSAMYYIYMHIINDH